MRFYVKLIKVYDTTCEEAREDLYANCTHVCNNLWLFEGDPEALYEGIQFVILGEEAIEGTGSMSGKEIIAMVRKVYQESVPNLLEDEFAKLEKLEDMIGPVDIDELLGE